MKEPNPLQAQRLSLRQFRQAVAERTEAEQAVAARCTADLNAANVSFSDVQQEAKRLQEKANLHVQSTSQVLANVQLQNLLHHPIPIATLALQGGADPAKELDKAVAELEQNCSRIQDNASLLEQWRRNKKTDKKLLSDVIIIVVALILGFICLYLIWTL